MSPSDTTLDSVVFSKENTYKNKLIKGDSSLSSLQPQLKSSSRLAIIQHDGTVVPVGKIEPCDDNFFDILRSVLRRSELSQAQRIQELIDEWLELDVKRRKIDEYKKECSELEVKKKSEFENASASLKELRTKMLSVVSL